MTVTAIDKLQPIWRLFTRLHSSSDTVAVAPPSAENVLTSGIIHVGAYNRIRLRCVGTDANNEAGGFNLYGWFNDGTYQVVATYTVTLGNKTDNDFTNAAIWKDDNIREQLTGTVFEADTYTETYDENAIVTASAQDGDAANFVEVDLSTSQYQWLQIVTSRSTAATFGAIWLPLNLKRNWGGIDVR